MEGYKPFKPDPNEIFGFSKPSVVTQPLTSHPDWRWILVGGILVLVFVYYYQNSRINELKKMVIRVKSEKEDS